MTAPQLEIQLVAVIVAVASALPGVFLVLRRMALLSDAITHSVLLGIVLAFFVVRDLGSPLLIVGAAMSGLATVGLIELLSSRRLAPDAAIGLVFPVIFSIGVILIGLYAGSVHLDTDIVLLGELAFVPFERVIVGGYDWGPVAAYKMGAILAVNVVFIALLFKELKLVTFDRALAASLGFSPAVLHYLLMGSVSITAVGAFDAVGSILVVALMIAPAATAYLLTDNLQRMTGFSALIGAVCAIAGFWLAHALDASIAGSMAFMAGVLFAGALLFAPRRGLLATARQRTRRRWRFAEMMLAMHLAHHEEAAEAERENRMEHLEEGLHWDPQFAQKVVALAVRDGYVVPRDGLLSVTEEGRALARRAFTS